MLDFRFSNDPTSRNIDATASLLVQPRLWIPSGDYPGHMDWRDKALSQLGTEEKRAILAFWGTEPVGCIIYQRDPSNPLNIEIKNISIEKEARGRHVASFLLRQVEAEAPHDFPGSTDIWVDTKRANSGIIGFLLHSGYGIEATTLLPSNFAHNGEPDVVLTKPL